MRADPGFWRQASPSLGAHGTIRSDIVFSGKFVAESYTCKNAASIRKMADMQFSQSGDLTDFLQPPVDFPRREALIERFFKGFQVYGYDEVYRVAYPQLSKIRDTP